MDRQTWLDQRQGAVLASYDQGAATYDEHGYPATAQQDWVARVLHACPPAAMILDAPCGTGRYFPMVAAAGHRVLGADQSSGMLAKAAGTSGIRRTAALLKKGNPHLRRLAKALLIKTKPSRADQALMDVAYRACDKCLTTSRSTENSISRPDMRRRSPPACGGSSPTTRVRSPSKVR